MVPNLVMPRFGATGEAVDVVTVKTRGYVSHDSFVIGLYFALDMVTMLSLQRETRSGHSLVTEISGEKRQDLRRS